MIFPAGDFCCVWWLLRMMVVVVIGIFKWLRNFTELMPL